MFLAVDVALGFRLLKSKKTFMQFALFNVCTMDSLCFSWHSLELCCVNLITLVASKFCSRQVLCKCFLDFLGVVLERCVQILDCLLCLSLFQTGCLNMC